MIYNIDKCKVLHIGSNNNRSNYTMNGTDITEGNEEKDLGVIIRNDLKPGKHCTEVVKTANKLVGFIGRTFEFKFKKVVRTLFNALVHPHNDYCVQFWPPYCRKDRQTRDESSNELPNIRYEERLKELNLFSFEK